MHFVISTNHRIRWFFLPGFFLLIGLFVLSGSIVSCSSGSDSLSSTRDIPSAHSIEPGTVTISGFIPSDYTLFIQTGSISITPGTVTGNGAATIPAWGYTTVDGGIATIPGPVLESVEGGTLTVTVVNNNSRKHNFVIQGVTGDQTAILPGGTRTYSFTTPKAGVFLYTDTLNNNVNRSLGLYGAVIVRAADRSNQAWSNGPSYTSERLWVVSDLDKPNWTDVAVAGGNVNTDNYRPNYFLMNGMNGFHAMEDNVNTNLVGRPGDVFLIRMVNAGQFDQSLHFHSNHFQVISKGGTRENLFPWQHVINLKAGKTAMVLFTLRYVGDFPMHNHTAQMETGNGVYLNGTAAIISAN